MTYHVRQAETDDVGYLITNFGPSFLSVWGHGRRKVVDYAYAVFRLSLERDTVLVCVDESNAIFGWGVFREGVPLWWWRPHVLRGEGITRLILDAGKKDKL